MQRCILTIFSTLVHHPTNRSSAELKLHTCTERSQLLPVFARQLKKLASLGEQASLFMHCVLDELCGRSLGYAQFGAAHELNPVVSSWRDFLSLAIGLQLSADQIGADLGACGLAEEFAALVVQACDARRTETRAALTRDVSKLSTCALKDFDWSMRVRAVCTSLTDCLIVHD